MAGQVKLCFVFLLAFHFSLVSCRRDYHHYYSRYVTGGPSTESSPLSATGISTSEHEHMSTSDSNSVSNNDAHEQRLSTPMVLKSYTIRNDDDVRSIAVITWGASVGGLIFLGVIVFFIIICCPCCCRGKQRRGFIIRSNVPAQPTTNLIRPQIPQQVAVQHYPPETEAPQYPPPYDTQPMQQHYQYPSTENLLQENRMQPMHQYQQPAFDHNNPPTAPPPYPTKY